MWQEIGARLPRGRARYTPLMHAQSPPQPGAAARAALLRWFGKHAADLPWRRQRNPYRIWLAEVMLMQTRVSTVLRYYERFLTALPTLTALADAPLDTVLKQWEGLGYYARARNLHQAARLIQGQHGGVIPHQYELLLALPGIGPYSAAAIASIAFGQATAAVDGNVRRVLTRLLDDGGDIRKGETQRRLARVAQDWLDRTAPGRHNEALMELGQRICRPRSPHCADCPLRPHCRAYARGTVPLRPVRSPRPPPRPELHLGALITDAQGRLLLRQRSASERLGRLWAFPGGEISLRDEAAESTPPAHAPRELARILRDQLGCGVTVGAFFSQAPLRITGVRGWLFVYHTTLPSGYWPVHANIRWLGREARARASFARAERVALAAWEAPLRLKETAQEED